MFMRTPSTTASWRSSMAIPSMRKRCITGKESRVTLTPTLVTYQGMIQSAVLTPREILQSNPLGDITVLGQIHESLIVLVKHGRVVSSKSSKMFVDPLYNPCHSKLCQNQEIETRDRHYGVFPPYFRSWLNLAAFPVLTGPALGYT